MNTKHIQAGDLRTRIRILRPTVTGSGSTKKTEWVDICNPSSATYPYIYSCWEGAYGSRAYIANSVQAQRPAQVTVRYRPEITEQYRIINDGVTYEIISPHDPDQHRRWTTMNVKAAVNG
jgi:head-tail adaptor